MTQKVFLIVVLVILLVTVLDIVALVVRAQTPVTTLSALDKETLKRTDLQLQMIRQQFTAAAQPVADEQNSVIKRVCAGAKIPVDQCAVDMNSGLIARKPAQTAAPQKPVSSPAPPPAAVK